jgi:hypothetical protein
VGNDNNDAKRWVKILKIYIVLQKIKKNIHAKLLSLSKINYKLCIKVINIGGIRVPKHI